MKNSANLCFAILLFVVVGCSCPQLSQLGKGGSEPPPPANASTPRTTSSPTSTTTNKGEYDVTLAKYEQIRNGMKRTEVEEIFGGKGTEFYNSKGGGSSFISVKYVGDNYKTIFVSYRNDRVTSKSQAGLN